LLTALISDSHGIIDRGLMSIPDNYILRPGEKVVILAEGPWEGEMASVSHETISNRDDGRVLVDVSSNWIDPNNISFINSTIQRHLFFRRELAIWNIPRDEVLQQSSGLRTSDDRLLKLLSTLKIEKKSSTSIKQTKRKNDTGKYKRNMKRKK
jgi:hypothetical protein